MYADIAIIIDSCESNINRVSQEVHVKFSRRLDLEEVIR